MKLQEQMDTFKKSFVEQVPEETLKVMNRAGEHLRDSGLADQAVKVGDKAPGFSLSNTSGTKGSFKNKFVIMRCKMNV